MSNLNLNISLPQELVLNLLNEAEQEQIDLSLHIANKLRLESYDSSFLNSDEAELALLSQAMYCAAHTREGEEFTLKDLFKRFEAEWGDVKSPRSFGRKFKKEILALDIAEIAGKKADNKLIYKRTKNTSEDVMSGKYFVDNDLLADGILKQ
jgi:hypothetical protein